MKIIIQASQAELTPEEVKTRLTSEQLAKAKGKVLVPYTVAEEGTSNPKVQGQGSMNLTWPRAVIEKVRDKIKSGTKLFHRHGVGTNSTKGRIPVGEILTTFTKEIGGHLRAISIACMESAEAQLYDICSIEAGVYENGGIVGDVEEVTALAVDNSKNDQPAFRNARRMAMVQCFNSPEGGEVLEKDKGNTMPTYEELLTVPLTDIKRVIEARQVHPAQLYTLKDIELDREFGSLVKDKVAAEAKITTLTETLTEKEKELTTINRSAAEASAKETFTGLLSKNLTEVQRNYMVANFDPSSLESVNESSIEAEMKILQESYRKNAKLFGLEETSENVNDEGADPEPTTSKDGIGALDEAFKDL